MKYEASAQVREAVIQMAQYRDSMIENGFTREETIDLLKSIIRNGGEEE